MEEEPHNSATIELLTERVSELTSRQRCVLRLVIQEQTSKEIAESLHISSHTVIYHRKAILKKLGLSGKVGFRKVYHILNVLLSPNLNPPPPPPSLPLKDSRKIAVYGYFSLLAFATPLSQSIA